MTEFSITKNGKVLDDNLYTWNSKTKTFSTKETGLVLNFPGCENITFITGDNCIFVTGNGCTFNTGHSCTFNTGSCCKFVTGLYCLFNTGTCCIIESNCQFFIFLCNGQLFNAGSKFAPKTRSRCILMKNRSLIK